MVSVYFHMIKTNNIESIRGLLMCVNGTETTILDPGINSNEAFKAACSHANKEIVELFLNDSRVDPNDLDGQALVDLFDKSPEILMMLLSNPSVKPTEQTLVQIVKKIWTWVKRYTSNESLIQDISKIILSNDLLDQTCEDNAPIVIASYFGFADIVEKLLLNEKVDPRMAKSSPDINGRVNRNYPIRVACGNKHTEVMNLLARDSRIDMYECIEDALNIFSSKFSGEKIVLKFLSLKKEIETSDKKMADDQSTPITPTIPEREFYKFEQDDLSVIVFRDSIMGINRVDPECIKLHTNFNTSYLIKSDNDIYHGIVSKYDL